MGMTDRDMSKAPPSGGAFAVEQLKNNGFISGKTIGGRNFNVAERRTDMQSEHVKIAIYLYIRILYNKYGKREHVQCPRAEYEREGNIMAKLSKISVCMLCALMSAATVLTACTAAPSGGEDNTGDLPSGQEPSGGDDGTKEEETWEPLVPYVNTLAGNVGLGATIAGPTMPNGSVHPSPETQNPENGGYRSGNKVVGFGQLYSQGTGGVQSYGNFLISPQVGELKLSDADHASSVSEEVGHADYYAARLDRYDIFAEVTPSEHASISSTGSDMRSRSSTITAQRRAPCI